MTLAIVRKLLETRLNANAGGIPVAFENVPYRPVEGSAWQSVFLMPAKPDDPTMGDGFNREPGVFQVQLFYPQNAGPGTITARAEAVRAAFPRGLSLSEGSVRVLMRGKPSLSQMWNDGAWSSMIVTIYYTADIQG